MKQLSAIVLILLAWLQYTLWFGQSGHFAQLRMRNELDRHHERAEVLERGNRLLTAEVLAMKQDPAALEARARRDLGMVKNGEVFYLIPDVGD